MSRSYAADWERKKSYLIRSLFHDIPYRALSPVLEESTQSSSAPVHEDSYQSSDRSQILQESITSEDQSSSESVADVPLQTSNPDALASPTGVYKPVPRQYSPLPPLIIERMPNRHDEPVEYYRKLLTKIKIIYRKMFLEGRSSGNDDIGSDFESNSIIAEAIALAKVSTDLSEESSYYSNEYSADSEMSDDEAVDVQDNFGNFKLTSGNRNNSFACANGNEPESDDDCDNVASSNVSPHSNIEGMPKTSSVSNEDPDYRQITIQVDVHIDGKPLAEVQPSPVYGEQQVEVTPVLANEGLPEGNSPSIVPEQMLRCTTLVPDSKRSSLEIPQILEHEAIRSPRCADPMNDLQAPVYEQSPRGFTPDLVCQTEPEVIPSLVVADVALEVTQKSLCHESARSPILSYNTRYKRKSEQKNNEVSEGQDSNREEIIAETGHSADCSQDSSSEIGQNPAFVLRFRKTGERSHVEEKQVTVTEDDHETTPSTEKTGNLTDSIEVMRTPRPEASQESNPVDTRLTSDMDFTCEHNTILRDVSNVTSQSQDGGQNNNTAESISSCGIDNLMASIFNESSAKTRVSSSIVGISKDSNSRKRAYEEISVQTETLTWNELRTNFFVGNPKIFRLCSCVDHFCNNN